MYNIKVLSYLIGSYNKMLASFGESAKTVKVFREQVLGLVNIGQVTQIDANLVFSIIGMTNTDSVKFEASKRNINCFILAMNYMETYKDDKNMQYVTLVELKNQKKISQKIYDIVIKIYNLSSYTKPMREVKEDFGKLKTVTVASEKSVSESKNKDLSDEWSVFLNTCSISADCYDIDVEHVYFQVRNPYCCCSNDPSTYKKSVKETINCFRTKSNSEFMKFLRNQAFTFSIVVEVVRGDGCHDRIYDEVDESLTDEARKLVLKETEKWKKLQNS